MEMFLNILFFLLGLVLLIKGADFFVIGASAIAKKLKVSNLIIGLTVVAIGTSLPELAISINCAIKGNVGISIGNIVGSNMANMFLIVGVIACISNIKVKKSTKNIEFPLLLIATSLLLLFASDSIINGGEINVISRTESIIFLALFIFYIFENVYFARLERKNFSYNIENEKYTVQQDTKINEKDIWEKKLKVWQMIIYLIVGIGAVIFGGECIARTSKFLALKAGMSENLVGLTIVAIGTSLPELATSIVAARKGKTDLAIGNIIGSNILNIVLVLAMTGVISQIAVSMDIIIDLCILLVSTIIFMILAIRKMELGRVEGIIFSSIYLLYIVFEIVKNYCF